MNDDEFDYWSRRSMQEAVGTINAACEESRLAHRSLAIMYTGRALASLMRHPDEMRTPESIAA